MTLLLYRCSSWPWPLYWFIMRHLCQSSFFLLSYFMRSSDEVHILDKDMSENITLTGSSNSHLKIWFFKNIFYLWKWLIFSCQTAVSPLLVNLFMQSPIIFSCLFCLTFSPAPDDIQVMIIWDWKGHVSTSAANFSLPEACPEGMSYIFYLHG